MSAARPLLRLCLAAGSIAFTDQARDMVLASIAPDASFGSKLAVVGSVSFWAFSSWIWSRAALDAGFKMRRDLPGLASWQKGWLTILCNHVPRVIGAASIAAVALAFQSGYAAYRDAGATADAERYRDYAIGVSILAVIFYLVLAIRKYLAVCLDDRIEEEKRIEEKLQAAPKDREANDDKTKETKTWRRVHSALNGLEWSILIASLVAFGLCSYWFATNPVAAAAFFGNSINVVLVGLALADARSRGCRAAVRAEQAAGIRSGRNHDGADTGNDARPSRRQVVRAGRGQVQMRRSRLSGAHAPGPA